jgi:transcriptional regulator with XRE-family HTH domain
MSFGQRIKKLRQDQEMSIADLAEKTGQPPEFIEQVESDSLTPPVSFLLQLSKALRIDSHFLTNQEKMQIDARGRRALLKEPKTILTARSLQELRTSTSVLLWSPLSQEKNIRSLNISTRERNLFLSTRAS